MIEPDCGRVHDSLGVQIKSYVPEILPCFSELSEIKGASCVATGDGVQC